MSMYFSPILAYPNPLTQRLFIEYELEETTEVRIEIKSEDGRSYFSKAFGPQFPDSYKHQINVEELQLLRGEYWVYMHFDKESYAMLFRKSA